jgi:acetyltransferase-like isoleucine patch superfamily enzyme
MTASCLPTLNADALIPGRLLAHAVDGDGHRIEGTGPIAALGYSHAPVYIGEGSWLGAYTFVGAGSRIGRGAVIGVKTVVQDDIPELVVAMGVPARVIRFRASVAL